MSSSHEEQQRRQRPKILLGFEDEPPTGEAVYIELSHLIATGITSKSGKTTTLEALADRVPLKLLAFKTKPGEEVYQDAHEVKPFFTEHADWQYVEALLEALMNEKQKYNRYWIIDATRGARSLQEVDSHLVEYLGGKKANRDSPKYQAYTLLHEYFKIVIPEIEKISFAREFPELKLGINIMDLSAMPVQVQALVMQSCLDHILNHEEGVVTQISECWKFLPQGTRTPVTATAMSLIRQGAVKGNYLWLDSQDISGVDKQPLKQVSTWVMGLQMETNEVKHTIAQVPVPRSRKPLADEIQTLKVGHFILATPEQVKHVYVQPKWLTADQARAVATGELKQKDVAEQRKLIEKIEENVAEEAEEKEEEGEVVDDLVFKEKAEALQAELDRAKESEHSLKEQVSNMLETWRNQVDQWQAEKERLERELTDLRSAAPFVDAIKIIASGAVAQVARATTTTTTEGIPLEQKVGDVELTENHFKFQKGEPTSNVLGTIKLDLADKRSRKNAIREALLQRGFKKEAEDLTGILIELVQMGFLLEEHETTSPKSHLVYRLPEKVQINVPKEMVMIMEEKAR